MPNYNDYSTWIRNRFAYRVQKISVNGGFTCPNRDGKLSRGGCTFCDNRSFNPSYCQQTSSIRQQLTEGKAFFARKYPTMKYLAYFQAYSNTYAPLDVLKARYEEALSVDDVVGIVIGTRPDCIDTSLLDYLEQLNRQTFLIMEYGIESTHDATLQRINRGHDFACSQRAVEATHARGILVGAHVIIGLPGEDKTMLQEEALTLSSLPIDLLKIHQLQLLQGTRLAQEYARQPFPLYHVDDYIHLLGEYLPYLRKDIVIERFVSQSPANLLIAPRWKMKNHEFVHRLDSYLQTHGIYQGSIFE